MAKQKVKKPVGEPIAKVKPKMKGHPLDAKIIELLNEGKNVNQVGAMLTVNTQYIKELIAKREK